MFIILWALGFWFVTSIIGTMCLSKSPPLLVGEIWAVIFFGSPLLGLILGARGILPGTKKITSKTHK
jgi:hypothetical protein